MIHCDAAGVTGGHAAEERNGWEETWQSDASQTVEENAYEVFQSIQTDGFAGEQFIRVSGTIS